MSKINYEGPGVAEKFLLVKLEFAAPPATKKSAKAHAAIVEDMVSQGADRDTAEAVAKGSGDLFPDGELRAIKTPFYSFNTWLERVSIRWLGGKGAPKLVSVHMLDKIEARFAEAQLVMLPLIAEFKQGYSQLLDSLENRVGHYFDRSDYPTVEQLDSRFRFELSFTPIGDPRQFDMGVVSEAQKDRMCEALDEAATNATRLYAKSIHTALVGDSQNPGLIKQLLGGKSDGKFTRFSENNVANLLEMVEADLNASGCEDMAAALAEVKSAAKLAADAAVHKDNKAVRTSAANAASKAANKLAGLF
jgi:hypothetical protein